MVKGKNHVKQVKKLVQIAMAPDKETLRNLQNGKQDEFSSVYKNMVDNIALYRKFSKLLSVNA